MQNFKPDQAFEFKLLKLLGIIAIAFGFILLYSGILGMTLNFLGIKDPNILFSGDPVESETYKNIFLIAQFTGSFIGIVILPGLYIYFIKPSFKVFEFKTNHLFTFLALTLLIILSVIPLINILNEWNQSIHLPAFLSSFETELKKMEETAEKATNLIVYYHNLPQFLIILTVISIIPAIGEELLFRGIVQNEVRAIFGNKHFAIWFAGFLFSFVHFQFFGFFPRMMLGVLLGYLYYWSGSILIPMFLHFMNNTITLIVTNLVDQKVIKVDLNSSKEIPTLYIIFSFTISMVLLYIFWKTGKEDIKVRDA